ncbi:unnamed protein product [Pieris macdunnoughi]|uniref:Uncharacterized protein n=2 Tax=Pieris TaxID=7115 RepID=A0A9P0TX69_PIEBR|nr:unnamed protein product [Pieris macdunnoughi]CAH4036557.1 unnamed protein product [Pieris brassicae]
MEGECLEGEGWLLVRVHVPELNVQKSLQFTRDQLVWDVKQQCLAALPKVATWYRVCVLFNPVNPVNSCMNQDVIH